MLPNVFSASPLVWAGLLSGMIALPILIHLINRIRHQTVQWAAMEFLLRSHRKHKNWIRLKQILLLLSRIAILLVALMMMAQIGCHDDRLTPLLGGTTQHHYILLDDSYSMSETDPGGRVFDRAIATLDRIVAGIKDRQNQRLTLLRFSEVGGQNDASESSESYEATADLADFNGVAVDREFDRTVEAMKSQLQVSQLAASAVPSLRLTEQLIQERPDEQATVYLVTDFRESDWQQSPGNRNAVQAIESAGASLEMIRCSSEPAINLGIARLEIVSHVRAVETPITAEITIVNHFDQPVSDVRVDLRSLEFPAADAGTRVDEMIPARIDLPSIYIERIEPGASETRSFSVYFRTPGSHVIAAQLQDDGIAADNVGFAELEVRPSARVLLVDQPDFRASSLLALALNPAGTTGLATEAVTRDFLRDASIEKLNAFDTIFLLDIASLDESAVDTLEQYVRQGGGVVFCGGPNINREFYNQALYRSGAGIFPIPLGTVADVPESLDDNAGDVQPVEHPVFAPALAVKNSLLDLVQIRRSLQPPIEWSPGQDREVEVLATIRGQARLPLVVEKSFGAGRCVALTTTIDPRWNNWMRNATFLPIVLLLQDHVAAGRYPVTELLTGETIQIDVPQADFQPQAIVVQRTLDEPPQAKSQPLTLDGESRNLLGPVESLPTAGIQETWLTTRQGDSEIRRASVNVDFREGQVLVVDDQALVGGIGGFDARLVRWDQFTLDRENEPSSTLIRLLMAAMVGLLIVEPLLAYATNYHTR